MTIEIQITKLAKRFELCPFDFAQAFGSEALIAQARRDNGERSRIH